MAVQGASRRECQPTTVLIAFGGSAAARAPVRAAAEFLPGGDAVVLTISTRHLCGSSVPAFQVDTVLTVGEFYDLAAGGEIIFA